MSELDFGEVYGSVGDGFIHVDHVVPVSAMGDRYRLDPMRGLVPVCPNCHAMLHRDAEAPPTIAALRKMIDRKMR